MSRLRRTTLGPVNHNTMGGRSSMMGSSSRSTLGGNSGMPRKRFSVAGAGQVGERRYSSVGGPGTTRRESSMGYKPRPSMAGGRKSSYGGGHGGGSRAADPRPLGDKKHVAASVRQLVNYLSDRGYDHPISPKILQRPTGRDFQNIVTFLFRQVDPNWAPEAAGSFENAVIATFKTLRYPFAISKTALSAVGSPHTWPTLLGSLTWLVELLEYDAEVEQARAEADHHLGFDGDQASDDRAFMDYLGRAYTAFLMGDDDLYAALEGELVAGFDRGQGRAAADLAALRGRNEDLQRQLQQLEARRDRLPQLEARARDLRSDRDKFRQLVVQLEDHRGKLGAKAEERRAEVAARKGRLAALQAEMEELRGAVAAQELSAEDVRRLGEERRRLEAGMQQAEAQRQEQSRRLWEAEMGLARAMEALDAAVAEYGRRRDALRLEEQFGKAGLRFGLRVDPAAKEEGEDGRPLLSGERDARASLAKYHETLRKQEQRTKQELLDLLDLEQETEEGLASAEEAVEACRARARRAQDALRRERAAGEERGRAAAAELEALEAAVAERRDGGGGEGGGGEGHHRLRAARHRTQQAKLMAEIAAAVEAHGVKRRALHEGILEVLTLCTDHKEHLQGQLSSLKELYERKRAAMDETR